MATPEQLERLKAADPAAYERYLARQTTVPPTDTGPTPGAKRNAELDRFMEGVTEPELDAARADAVRARALDLQENVGLSRPDATSRSFRESQARVGWQTPPVAPGVVESTLRAAAVRRVPGDDPRSALSALTRDFVANRMTPAAERAYRLLLPEGAENKLLGTPEDQAAARKELEQAYGSSVVEALRFVEATDPYGTTGPVAGKAAEVLTRGLPKQSEDDAGVMLEVPETAALRFFGDYIPSVASETVYAAPVLAAKQDGKVVRPDDFAARLKASVDAGASPAQALAEGLGDLDFGISNIEQVFLNTTPEERGLLPDAVMSDRWPLTRAYIRAMQKLENNRTIGDDFEAAATKATADAPEDSIPAWAARKAAYAGGLAAQTFLPWEMVLRPVTGGIKAARAASALPEGIDRWRAFTQFATGRQMDLAKDMRRVAEDALRGGIDPNEWLNDLRLVEPEFVDTVRAMLAEERGSQTPWEMLRPKAPDLPPSPGPLREPPPAPARVDLQQRVIDAENAAAPRVRDLKDRIAVMMGRPAAEFEELPNAAAVQEKLDAVMLASMDRLRGAEGQARGPVVPLGEAPPRPPSAPIPEGAEVIRLPEMAPVGPLLSELKDELAVMMGRPAAEFEDSPEFAGILDRLDEFFLADANRDLARTGQKPQAQHFVALPAGEMPAEVPIPSRRAIYPGEKVDEFMQRELDRDLGLGKNVPNVKRPVPELPQATGVATGLPDLPKVREALTRATQQAGDEAAEGAAEAEDIIARIRAQAAENVKAAGLDRPLRSTREYFDYVSARTRALLGAEKPVVTATKLQPPVGGGYQALRHLDPPDASPATPSYRLMDKGEVVVVGPLDQVLQAMKGRKNFADRIDFDGRRFVASWRGMEDTPEAVARNLRRRRSAEKLVVDAVADRDFASPAERAMVAAKMKGETLDVSDVVKRASAQTAGAGLPEDTFTRVLAAVLGSNPKPRPRPVRALTPEDLQVLDAVEDTMRARLRSTYGNDAIVSPRVGMVLTRPEWSATLRSIEKAQVAAGFDKGAVKLGGRLRTGRELDFGSDANRQAATAWAARSGVVMPSGPMTDDEFTAVFDAVLKVEAGRSADARWAIQGAGDTSTKLLDGIAKLDGTFAKPVARVILGAKYIERYKVSRNVRQVFDAVERELRAVPAELLRDLMEAKRNGARTTTDALHQVLETYRPVPQREVDLVEAIGQVESGQPATWRAMAERIRQEDLELSRYPGLNSKSNKEAAEAVAGWAQDKVSHMNKLTRQLIRAAIADHPRYEELVQKLAESQVLNKDQGVLAWRSFVADSNIHGATLPLIEQVFGPQVAAEVAKFDPQRALTNFALVLKSDEVAADGARRLQELEFGVSNLEAFDFVMKGGPRPATLSDADVYKARALVNRLGLDQGSGPAVLGEFSGVQLPKGWVDELNRAKAAGVRMTEDKYPIVSWLYGAYKSALTSYNPAFHITNTIGIPYMLLQQRGLSGSLAAASALGKRPAIALTLGLRLSGVRAYQPKWLDRVENTVEAGGRIYSIETIERALLRGGVGQGQAAALNGRKIEDALARSSGLWSKIRTLPSDAHDAITGMSGVLEGAVRAGVALDALERGSSLDEAAAVAREALYDYDNLTDFDQQVAKWGLVFWKFHRKNLDGFWKQVADNPERVGIMLRYAQHQRTMLMSEQEQAFTRANDVGRVVLGTVDTDIGRLLLSTGSVLTAPEALMLTLDLVRASPPGIMVDPAGSGESIKRFMGQAHPAAQAIVTLGLGVDVSSGYRIDAALSNEVPSWLQYSPITQPLVDAWLDVEPKPLPPGSPREPAGYGVNGPYVYVPGDGTGKEMPGDDQAKNIRDWRLLETFGLGRLVGSTAQQAYTAATAKGAERGAAMFRFFGGTARPLPAEGEAEGAMMELRKPAESELQRMKAQGEAATR